MEYRSLQQEEILPALHMVWDVFVQDVAPDYTPEGVADFQNFIKYENIYRLWSSQNLFLFGAINNKKEVVGVIALQPDGMIRLFYVRKDAQGKGTGRQLFQMAYNFCVENLHVQKIWVHAAPGAVQKYLHFGMVQTGEMQMENGKAFVPMEMTASPGLVKPVKDQKNNTTLIAVIVAGVIILILLFVGGSILIRNLFNNSRTSGYDPYGYGEEYPDNGWYDYDWGYGDNYGYGFDDEYEYDDSDSGIAAIPEYLGSSLPYELGEDTVTENGDSMQSTVVSFSISYPTVTGLGDELDEKINALLKDCATQTMDEIYTNPSEEIKERVLQAQYPILASNVSYKVCYANENFISVAFQDYYYAGNSEEYGVDLRCLNINLTDGSVYQLTDLVNVDEAFVQAWLPVMRSEADNTELLSELSDSQMEEALKGDSLDGVYNEEFFFDENGIEIGFSFDYPSEDENDQGYGWVTAPFSFEEIQAYETDNAFWQSLDEQG